MDILYKKFHETILNNFGFRNYPQQTLNFTIQPQSSTDFIARVERAESNIDNREKSSDKRGLNNSRVSTPIRNQQ